MWVEELGRGFRLELKYLQWVLRLLSVPSPVVVGRHGWQDLLDQIQVFKRKIGFA